MSPGRAVPVGSSAGAGTAPGWAGRAACSLGPCPPPPGAPEWGGTPRAPRTPPTSQGLCRGPCDLGTLSLPPRLPHTGRSGRRKQTTYPRKSGDPFDPRQPGSGASVGQERTRAATPALTLEEGVPHSPPRWQRARPAPALPPAPGALVPGRGTERPLTLSSREPEGQGSPQAQTEGGPGRPEAGTGLTWAAGRLWGRSPAVPCASRSGRPRARLRAAVFEDLQEDPGRRGAARAAAWGPSAGSPGRTAPSVPEPGHGADAQPDAGTGLAPAPPRLLLLLRCPHPLSLSPLLASPPPPRALGRCLHRPAAHRGTRALALAWPRTACAQPPPGLINTNLQPNAGPPSC